MLSNDNNNDNNLKAVYDAIAIKKTKSQTQTKITGMMDGKCQALFTGKYIEYGTPRKLYDELNNEFHFDLDPCTTTDNPLQTPYYYTKEHDGLKEPWSRTVFVNPPYGKDTVKWIEKAWHEIHFAKTELVVMLLPARTDVKWFHTYIYNKPNVEVRFIRGRLRFITTMGINNTAPFPSMLVIFRGNVNSNNNNDNSNLLLCS